MKNNLKMIQDALDQMVFAWNTKKFEAGDSETKEFWIVETLDPQSFHSFYDALDSLFVRFRDFKKELRERWIKLNERLKEEPYPKTNTDSLILYAGIGLIKEILGEQ